MKLHHKLILLFVFSLFMANLEAVIVVYLRELYYPEGFHFPLKLIPTKIFIIELIREFSTIVMLLSIGILCGKFFIERFFYFIFCFGVWDIFYYVWLKLFLNWPESLMTDDILFLIPVPWIAPVYAPVTIAISMIIFSLISFYLQQKGYVLKTDKFSTLTAFVGVVLILFSFTYDFQKRVASISPVEFPLLIFLIGEILLILSYLLFLRNMKKLTG
ncbi:hypothetical protein [Rosettibacter firmus]|uniref:hypothetical protein n=1 Tax=Rosettibacter firmus TaxID=3111522 RepID=UPI00336C0FCF